uniref:Claudin 12 n=1 Tax=Sphaeramia orbicularis TaxID=375764 RepID=A0A673A9Y3_9TELE
MSWIAVAALIPQWRVTRLVTFNRNAKNISVYDGLWAKCVKQDGYSGCYYYDSEWYSKVDQLDLRLLQFCLPTGLLFGSLALLLCMAGMCKTCCCSDKPEPDIKTTRFLVNSAGCHLVAGMFLFLGGAIAIAPSVWFLFRTKEMNKRYDNIFSDGFAAYVSIGCSGGLMLAALLMFMWYCMCKKLPSPFWLPLPSMPTSLSTQPLTANGYPPSPNGMACFSHTTAANRTNLNKVLLWLVKPFNWQGKRAKHYITVTVLCSTTSCLLFFLFGRSSVTLALLTLNLLKYLTGHLTESFCVF